MHMEYLFQLTQIRSLIEQSLKIRGDNKLAEEISYIYRNPDYMIHVSVYFRDLRL